MDIFLDTAQCGDTIRCASSSARVLATAARTHGKCPTKATAMLRSAWPVGDFTLLRTRRRPFWYGNAAEMMFASPVLAERVAKGLIVFMIFLSDVARRCVSFARSPAMSEIGLPDRNLCGLRWSNRWSDRGNGKSSSGPPAFAGTVAGHSERIQLPLPPSRKVRALLAYLAMAPRPVTREKLCELFWDVADDPKSELRWCLSKLRPLINGPTTMRLIADREKVWIDANSLDIDAVSVAYGTQQTLACGSPRDLQSL